MMDELFVRCVKNEFMDGIRNILMRDFDEPVRIDGKFINALAAEDLVSLKDFICTDYPIDTTYKRAFELARPLLEKCPASYNFIMSCQLERCIKTIVAYGLDNDRPGLITMALNTDKGVEYIEADEKMLFRLRKHVINNPLPLFISERFKASSYILKSMLEHYSV